MNSPDSDQQGNAMGKKSDSPTRTETAATVVVLIISFATNITFFVVYVLSITEAFQARGLIWACIVAIPGFGQLMWFGFQWSANGLLNLYTLVVAIGLALYAVQMGVTAWIAKDEKKEE